MADVIRRCVTPGRTILSDLPILWRYRHTHTSDFTRAAEPILWRGACKALVLVTNSNITAPTGAHLPAFSLSTDPDGVWTFPRVASVPHGRRYTSHRRTHSRGRKYDAGRTGSRTRAGVPADVTWLQGGPLRMAGLRGKPVLIDFWDYTCVNCLRTLPVRQGVVASLRPAWPDVSASTRRSSRSGARAAMSLREVREQGIHIRSCSITITRSGRRTRTAIGPRST